jgi:hypothetical protein
VNTHQIREKSIITPYRLQSNKKIPLFRKSVAGISKGLRFDYLLPVLPLPDCKESSVLHFNDRPADSAID